ncbi:DNA adenine methylase [Leeuwenhoekiella sp. A2]|uniref:DNA adenine methylase n=1 Tax=Leeuwenhoekiella sp. A2 TaxID=3141460 RepID=UPI003A8016CA
MANKKESRFDSPLRYPGGKARIFPFVSNLIYENDLIGCSYAEPYAGGGGLALKLLFDEFVSSIYINDLDKSIYALWVTMLNDNVRFCDWIEDLDVTVENWIYYKNIQKKPENIEQIELAKSTFFLNRTNVSGVIKGGMIGGFEQKGKYKIDVRFNKDDLIKRIKKIHRFRERIYVSNLDGLQFIKKMGQKKEDVFIYLDPPYYQKGADLYMNFYKEKDHKKLSEKIRKTKNRWMVSYDNHDFILNLYSEKNKLTYKLSQSTSNRIGDEVLIFSDNLIFNNSMDELKSAYLLP